MNKISLLTLLIIALSSTFSFKGFAQTQITSDDTIPTNIEDLGEGIYQIQGGSRPNNGVNLFHSFETFALDSGDIAQFIHNSGIENIITRITGGSISEIDGTIQTLIEGTSNRGTADFFFINPAGIQLGENATLDIGGSFIASTAESLQFADGTEFNAINPSSSPLLTVSVPIGLQYGDNLGDIEVQGIGNNLSTDPFTNATNRNNRPTGFQVPAGETLALLGGNITLEGGNVTAEAGRVEVWSVANGQLSLSNQNGQLTVDNSQGTLEFLDITLSQAASIDTTGNRGGEIQLQGRQIILQEGSVVFGNTLGSEPGGLIEIQASETLEIQGLSEDNLFPSGIFAEVEPGATGNSGDLNVETQRLFLDEGGNIFLGTFSSGTTGSLTIKTTDLEIRGGTPANGVASSLSNFIFFGASGDAGELNVETERLLISEGGNIAASTFGPGTGGDLSINAQSIELRSDESTGNLSGLFSLVFPGTSGNGGSIVVSTERLSLTDGSAITVTTFGDGDAGEIDITAQDIEVTGFGAVSLFPSGVFASTQPGATGNGGTLRIQTGNLTMSDGAQILTSTFGAGNAGELQIQAESITLGGVGEGGRTGLFSGAIIGDGNGGNVTVTADELEVRDGATISVSNFKV